VAQTDASDYDWCEKTHGGLVRLGFTAKHVDQVIVIHEGTPTEQRRKHPLILIEAPYK